MSEEFVPTTPFVLPSRPLCLCVKPDSQVARPLLPQAQAAKRVPCQDRFDQLLRDTGQSGALCQRVHTPQPGHRLLWSEERKIGAEQDAVSYPVFYRRNHRLVKPPGPTVQRREVRVEVGVLADGNHTLGL